MIFVIDTILIFEQVTHIDDKTYHMKSPYYDTSDVQNEIHDISAASNKIL